jgi:hypothetical protein
LLLSRIRYRFHRKIFKDILTVSDDMQILEPIVMTDYLVRNGTKLMIDIRTAARSSKSIRGNNLIGISCTLMYLLIILLMMNCLLDMLFL